MPSCATSSAPDGFARRSPTLRLIVSERDELLLRLGLSPGASWGELANAYLESRHALEQRRAEGDEPAGAELAALESAYEWVRAADASPGPDREWALWSSTPQTGEGEHHFPETLLPAGSHTRPPAWWEAYVALVLGVLALVSLGWVAIVGLEATLDGKGIVRPLGALAVGGLFGVLAMMMGEKERRLALRSKLLAKKEAKVRYKPVAIRSRSARSASVLGRAAAIAFCILLVVTVFLFFASMSDRWSIG